MEIRPLAGIEDPLVPDWFEVYEISFRQEVRGLAALLLRLLRAASPEYTFLAALEAGRLIGIALYQEPPALPAGYLWYIAIAPAHRNAGYGAQLYRAVLERLRPGTEALFLDVELAEREPTAQERALAERRILFYQRLGAQLLPELRFWEQVSPKFPPEPLAVFAHPLRTADPQRLRALAMALYGERLQILSKE